MKFRPGAEFRRTLEFPGDCCEGPGRPWGRFWLHHVVCDSVHADFCGKMCFVNFDASLQRNTCLSGPGDQVGATGAPKAAPERPKVNPGGQVRAARTVKLALSARSCCKRYGTHRKPSQNQVEAELKVYLADHSYD